MATVWPLRDDSPDDEAKGGTITFGFDVNKLKDTLAATIPIP